MNDDIRLNALVLDISFVDPVAPGEGHPVGCGSLGKVNEARVIRNCPIENWLAAYNTKSYAVPIPRKKFGMETRLEAPEGSTCETRLASLVVRIGSTASAFSDRRCALTPSNRATDACPSRQPWLGAALADDLRRAARHLHCSEPGVHNLGRLRRFKKENQSAKRQGHKRSAPHGAAYCT